MRTKLRALRRTLFSPRGTIPWSTYLLATLAIFALKYPLDACFAGHAGEMLPCERYWQSSLFDGLQFAVGWAIRSPFGFLEAPLIWSGLALAAKRMRSIGWPEYAVALFFVPFVNYVTLALLIATPDRNGARGSRFPPCHRHFTNFAAAELGSSIRGAILAFVCLLAIVSSTAMVESFRFFLILLAGPMLAGLFATVTYSPRDENSYQGLSWVSVAAAAGYCILAQFGFENAAGMICATPVAALFALFGSLMGGLLIEWVKPADLRKWG